MGKSLIIKGADFSANAISKEYEWFVDDYSLAVQSGLSITAIAIAAAAGFTWPKSRHALYQGKAVNVIRFKAHSAGTISIFRGVNASTDTPRVAEKIADIMITSDEEGTEVIKNFPTIIFGNDECLVISSPQNDGLFAYCNNQSAYDGSSLFGLSIGTASGYYYAGPLLQTLTVDLGYYG